MLTKILETEDYRIIEAVDGEQAFAKADSEIPDLIIMDVMMPIWMAMKPWQNRRSILQRSASKL